jgi:Flp pilus assembly protein CpaB
MENKKKSPVTIIVFAVLIGFLVIALLSGTIRPTQALVAKESLAPGTILTEDLVELRSIPAGGVPNDALRSSDELAGKMLTVGRAPGDFITTSVLGETAASGIPSQLEAGHVALAVRVTLSSGVAGLLREGQTVTVLGMLSPDVVQNAFAANELPVSVLFPTPPAYNAIPDVEPATPTPTATPAPLQAPLARIAISGVKVLLVPQTFRYQELPPDADSNEQMFASSMSSKSESVIVLDVPTTPVEVAPGLLVNPATLLSALDEYGKLHLALEPAAGLQVEQILTLNLGDLYQSMNQDTGKEK